MARKATTPPSARPDDPLALYNAKRDFTRTAEPKGELADSAGNIFMVQKHAATRLHWDFRLELDGVLKSWAVTRGPSLDPDDKRLAVRTEDHPLGYATFEGTIPKGDYGGGTVMLWDRGTWTPHPGKDPRKTLEEGHLHFTLEGERMKGEWIMIRLKPRGREKNENWLLRKVADDHAGGGDDLVARAVTSVATGRTMEEIAAGVEAKPAAKAKASAAPRARKSATAAKTPRPRGKASNAAPPAFRDVQLATLVDAVPAGAGWLNEVKYDGYRALVAVGGGKARAFTRTGLDWSDRFGSVVEAAAAQIPGTALIDGEMVVLDANGRPSFQALQAALKEGGDLHYFAFDLLEQDGEDLTALPNIERKGRLAALLEGVQPPLHYAEHIEGGGEKLFASLCGEGYEGIIAKRADAPYRGRRSQAWLKVKCLRRQEFVIVGWTPSDKGARGFRSLLLGVHEDGRLRYAGKVGTGFDAATLAELSARLKRIERKTPTVEAPRAAVRGAHWVKPALVAEIAFTETTGDGVLRHPSFLGLREDKPAADVTVETPVAVTPPAKGKAKAKAPPAPTEPADSFAGIRITNPDRVIYPEARITKGQLAAYYAAVAEPMLQWAANRPVSLVRCPQGRAKHCFFQKHDAGSFGEHVHHVPVREKDGSEQPYLYVEDAAGLIACVQMGAIEFHGWGASAGDVERPDRLVFDLDPDEGLDFAAVRNAAVMLRDALAGMGLVTFPMVTGGKGVHVVAPLDASVAWPEVKDFASRFARAMEAAHPDRFTANMKKVQRTGRIFLDWLRNQRGATAILPYAARARPNAPVAAPITWDELAGMDAAGRYTIADAAELIARAGSPALRGWGVADQALPQV
ncbi:DNA ligase D [Sphingomonas jatrophae]|uniref:DNA ligase (ATP) n=1 Tax=Sphingomonas jatrophae TaxID=1166337 RepID=A0A1I6L1S5_9SPHN|nr:DNA ligase D [Sphingomonas jatrophae]SFR97160.1 bifunctional non-homologous end joining protein LigD [Sphingomonas jatrophae]